MMIRGYILSIVCFVTSGCLVSASHEGMRVAPGDLDHPLEFSEEFNNSIALGDVIVTKGANISASITKANLTTALWWTLDYFLLAPESSNPKRNLKYKLDVNLLSVTNPGIGLTQEVDAKIQYRLRDYASGTELLTKTISSTGSSSLSSNEFGGILVSSILFGQAATFQGHGSADAATRGRLATEASVKLNLARFLILLKEFTDSG